MEEINNPSNLLIPEEIIKLNYMRLDYKKMVKDIDKLVNNDVCFELEMYFMPNSKEVSQVDAKKAIEIIGQVYMISHGITCEACNKKYRLSN